MAVFAPIPSASVSTAIPVKAGFFASIRAAYFKSCHKVSMYASDFSTCRGGFTPPPLKLAA
jgi:hypothetical protein